MNRCPIGTIHVTGSVTITGNFLGTTPQGGPLTDGSPQNRGIYALGAQSEPATTDVVVGGPDPADRNLISGHTAVPVSPRAIRAQFYTRLTVQGNLIGVDATASYTISNGIGIFSGATPPPRDRRTRRQRRQRHRRQPVDRHLRLGAQVFQGNFIGTNAAETASLGNLGGGLVGGRAEDGAIGGLGPGEGNVFAWNGGGGISGYPAASTSPAATVTVRGNRFYGNVRVAIALGFNPPNAADPGDADTGPNGLQNAPVARRHRLRAADGRALRPEQHALDDVRHRLLRQSPLRRRARRRTARARSSSARSRPRRTRPGSRRSTSRCPRPSSPGQGVSAIATDPGGNTSEFSQTILLKTTPRSGPAAGGGSVTLSGQLFEAGATVTVGGVAPSNVVVTPPYTITADMPGLRRPERFTTCRSRIPEG